MLESAWSKRQSFSVGGTLEDSFMICIKGTKLTIDNLGTYPKEIATSTIILIQKVYPNIVYNIKTSRNSINIH